MPKNPKNARDMKPAVTSPIAVPSNGFGIVDIANRSLNPANRIKASANPSPEENEKTIILKKGSLFLIQSSATPSTAQLVVISGRKIPNA